MYYLRKNRLPIFFCLNGKFRWNKALSLILRSTGISVYFTLSQQVFYHIIITVFQLHNSFWHIKPIPGVFLSIES